jgi:DNA-binding IclR family transcriptional regulator
LLQTNIGTKRVIERKSKGQIGLGMRILEPTKSPQHQINRKLHTLVQLIMEKLTEKTMETSVLAVRARLNVTCIQFSITISSLMFVENE